MWSSTSYLLDRSSPVMLVISATFRAGARAVAAALLE